MTDAERLDWLEDNQPVDISKVRESECAGDFFHVVVFKSSGADGVAKTLRKAIDAACEAEKQIRSYR